MVDETRSLEAGEHAQRALEATEAAREHTEGHETAGEHFSRAVEHGRNAAMDTDAAQEHPDSSQAVKLHERSARQARRASHYHHQAAHHHFISHGQQFGMTIDRSGNYRFPNEEDRDIVLAHPGYVLNNQANHHWSNLANANTRAARHLRKASGKGLEGITSIKMLRDKYR